MAFRTVVISSHSKIEYSLEYLVFRTIDGVKRIHLDEISTVIFETTNISITSSILIELVKRKINVIFCDEKHNPIAQLNALAGSHISFKRIIEQIEWKNETKDLVWKEIVKAKIRGQSIVLEKYGREKENYKLLDDYINDVEVGDITNREGHAAKVYFNSLFHENFSRAEDCNINAILNYGYSIILSLFNRVVISSGYLTQLGIHHKNEYNQFNFSCDLMEPFRPFVDIIACNLKDEKDNVKDKIVEILAKEIQIGGMKQSFTNAINIYTYSVIDALNNNNPSKIKFPESYDI